MEPRFNYIALLIVIIVGVTAGNLISTWLTTKTVESESNHASAESPKEIATKAKEKKQESNNQVEPIIAEDDSTQEQLMKQRRYDPNGSRLAKNCNEWRQANKDMNTQTSKLGMTKHCDIYDEYVRTGVLPASN